MVGLAWGTMFSILWVGLHCAKDQTFWSWSAILSNVVSVATCSLAQTTFCETVAYPKKRLCSYSCPCFGDLFGQMVYVICQAAFLNAGLETNYYGR